MTSLIKDDSIFYNNSNILQILIYVQLYYVLNKFN